MATTDDPMDFPRRVTSSVPMSAPPAVDRRKGVSLDLDEEVRLERDADVDRYHEWQGRMSAWLRNPVGPQPY